MSRLSLVSADRLMRFLGVEPGSVSLLSLLNDSEGEVEVVVDADLWKAEAFQCHPLVNTSTLVISKVGVERFLTATGHVAHVVDVPGRLDRPTDGPDPSPDLFFDTVKAYQRTAVLKGAVELGLFIAIGEGKTSVSALAEGCNASERGIQILCDYLVVAGFLTKHGDRYGLTVDTATFLDAGSPAYLGRAVKFLVSPMLMEAFKDVAAMVRKGGTILDERGTLEPEHPAWVQFARSMVSVMRGPAGSLAKLIDPDAQAPLKVLDIAAGHGLFGIAFGERNAQVEVVGLDWSNVLAVAREHAEAAGLGDRYQTIEGSALEVDYGVGYDLILLPNFLHHFDREMCIQILRKVYVALNDNGRAVTLEFVPNDDRVTPAEHAAFSMVMLASTPGGDVYTFSELEGMFREAGFLRSEVCDLEDSEQTVVLSYKM